MSAQGIQRKGLVASGITRRYGGFNALEDVDLAVAPSERHALIGPNGAGKTTMFHILGGQVAPSAGSIAMDGEDITTLPPYSRVALGIARTFQRNNLFFGLSVFENIRLSVQAHTDAGRKLFQITSTHRAITERAQQVVEQFSLQTLAQHRASELSYGDQRKLEIAVALAGKPRVLLVDEPTAGMSPAETAEMVKVLAGMPRDISLLIVEHDMDVVSALADKVTVLQNGRLIASGTWDEIRVNEFVQQAYMGARRPGKRH
jgi:branched-chain amino acid transport system ATP-binding protein